MYKQLSELIVRVADLAEAEGRVLRRAAGRLGIGVAVGAAGAVLLVIGAGFVIAAVWLALEPRMGAAGASAVTGAAALVMAGAALYAAGRMSR